MSSTRSGSSGPSIVALRGLPLVTVAAPRLQIAGPIHFAKMAPASAISGRIVTSPRGTELRMNTRALDRGLLRGKQMAAAAIKTLKIGAVLLSIWSGVNLCVAAGVTLFTLLGRKPPALALVLTDSEIAQLDPRAIDVVNAQASLANPSIVALCTLTLVVVWTCLVRGARWAWLALVGTLLPLQALGFISDAFLGHRNIGANILSSGLLLGALVLSGVGLRAARP